jgi:hypothetical protein
MADNVGITPGTGATVAALNTEIAETEATLAALRGI